MNRGEVELQTGERFEGISGLWLTILLGLMSDYQDRESPDHEEARRIIEQQEEPFGMIADALQITPGALRRRVIRAVGRTQR